MTANRLGLFQAFGVELEYMLVRRGDLAVLPLSDEALRRASGGEAYVCDVERDGMAWSNELVAHLVELKVDPPARDLAGLAPKFDAEIAWMNGLLEAFDARLMPSAMHPFMRPEAETKLWPHEYREIYESYHKAFDCRRHGWANLQSAHLNLPFADDAEFGRLHAAIRLLLPLLPALAASSPYQEGRATGLLDTRPRITAGTWPSPRRPSAR